MNYPPPSAVSDVARDYPHDMVHSCANAAIIERGLTQRDLMWILASFELQKPRVHSVTISDGVQTSERFS